MPRLPRFMILQLLGLLTLCVLRPALASLSNPDQYIPLLTQLWLALCALSYATSYVSKVRLGDLGRQALKYLPQVWLLLTIASWAFGLRVQLPLMIGYVVLAIYNGTHQRVVYKLSGLHLICLGFFVASAVGLLWAEYPREGWRILEKQLPLLLLPLTALTMPQSSSNIAWVTKWLCRLLFSALTLQIAQYLYLSTFYAEHLWDCLSLNKVYLAPDFGGVVHEKVMLWSEVIHPSWWLFFLVTPYLLQCHALFFGERGREGGARRQSFLTTPELVTYGIGLILFGFITQPRYGLWVTFIALGWFPLQWLLRRLPRLWAAGGLVGLVWAFVLSLTWVLDIFKDEERQAMMGNALAYIRSTWPLGGGLGADRQIQLEAFNHRHSHNALLTMMVDMGLWGAVVWLGFLGGIVWLCVGRKGRQNMPFLLFFFLLLLLLVVDSVLYVGIMLPLIALYICMLGSEIERKGRKINPLR